MNYSQKFTNFSEQEILKLSEEIVENTNIDTNYKDPFWNKCAKVIFSSHIGLIISMYPKKKHNLKTLYELLTSYNDNNNEPDFNEIDIKFKELEILYPKHFALNQYKPFRILSENTAFLALKHSVMILNYLPKNETESLENSTHLILNCELFPEYSITISCQDNEGLFLETENPNKTSSTIALSIGDSLALRDFLNKNLNI